MTLDRTLQQLKAPADEKVRARRLLRAIVVTAAMGLLPAAAWPEEQASRAAFVGSVDVGAPLMVSVSAAAAFALRPDGLRPGHHGLTGPAVVVELEPGVAGAKIAAGFTSFGGGASYHVHAVTVRTWNKPIFARDDTTYAGIELGARALALRFAVGPLYSLSPERGHWAAVATVGIGY